MRRFGILGAALAAACALAAGCQSEPPATARDVAVDLRDYVRELRRWEPIEKEVFGALIDVERTYYVDDDFVARRFRSAVPKIEQHVNELETYRPATPDLQAVHERYVHGWEEMGDGFEAVIAAVEAKDYLRLASAKNQVQAGRKKILAAFEELDYLIADTEPELKKLRRKAILAERRDEEESAEERKPGETPEAEAPPRPPVVIERVPIPTPKGEGADGEARPPAS